MSAYYQAIRFVGFVLAVSGGCLLALAPARQSRKTLTLNQVLAGECADGDWIELRSRILSEVSVAEDEKVGPRFGGGVTMTTSVYVPMVDDRWTPDHPVGVLVESHESKMRDLLASSTAKGTVYHGVNGRIRRIFAQSGVTLSPNVVVINHGARPVGGRGLGGILLFAGIFLCLSTTVILTVLQRRQKRATVYAANW